MFVAKCKACCSESWESVTVSNQLNMYLNVPLPMQRFASGSLFKRTVFQYIAEDLAADPGTNTAMFCMIDSEARPVVTMPTDSPLQNLLSSLDLEENETVDRHRISEGLQRLGESCSLLFCGLQHVPKGTLCPRDDCTHHVTKLFSASVYPDASHE